MSGEAPLSGEAPVSGAAESTVPESERVLSIGAPLTTTPPPESEPSVATVPESLGVGAVPCPRRCRSLSPESAGVLESAPASSSFASPESARPSPESIPASGALGSPSAAASSGAERSIPPSASTWSWQVPLESQVTEYDAHAATPVGVLMQVRVVGAELAGATPADARRG